ncbi:MULTISPECIES: cell envelope integrity protein TolA [unclassified Gilliamella]|uniref:cell envelope integrity protein TolA n=1 Tax=unclassified Gilliamella TaxID=2685620 RepID=UPI00226AD32D|nr:MULTISPECIES: cell envelope integrity protein TolA [unclassified Gilliamella]MCX8600509.1 cell envelope integrity protein TolA [Gilliamella sp. B3722]MCX8608779.1 cell envelope integrity protein TolA [Gilliamella sp. B3771]MCX8609725.1 cell envelope integrity protein TolA [Gilliamella sp. B3891]MCX8612185.1 cell envelope integrity protein TolA [Gilliamella sp. B3773]MCX8616579.1 cell envelope integrity protein TolA [Gilliamella sp. B3770]
MSNKLNSKLSVPVLISIILHGIIIVILGYRFMQDSDANFGSINGNSIDAIMVDPSVLNEQYQRQLQSQINQQSAHNQRQEQINSQTDEFLQKQFEQQEQLKQLEKERQELAEKQRLEQIAANEAAKEAERAIKEAEKAVQEAKERAAREAERIAQEAKEKAEKEAKERAEKEAKERAEKEAKERAEKEAKERAEKEAKERAEKEAKEKAAKEAAEKAAKEKAARARAEQAKRDKELNQLLGGLTSGSSNSSSGTPNRRGVSNGELGKYISLVQTAIRNNFNNPNGLYSGKNCILEIQIAPDGLLLNVNAKGGDDALCREALTATKLAVIPKPTSALYNQVKTMTIDFQPK